VAFQWVKGHSQDPWNERADQLAVAAALSQSSARG
jgi:ribonuclease HI